MYTLLSIKARILLGIALLGLGYVLAFMVVCEFPTDLRAFAARFSLALAIATALGSLLGHHAVVNAIWSKVRYLNLLAPNLNGRYQLKNSSNWPIKKWMLDATQGKLQSTPATAVLDVVGELKVQLGLFYLRMEYTPSEQIASRSSSSVLCSSFHASMNPERFEFTYMYVGRPIQPDPQTDEQQYYGCAHLSVPKSAFLPTSLSGNYWTNRSWNKGLNTAGQVVATRI